MRLSIIIPHLNQGTALGACLRALDRESWAWRDLGYEVLVVDNGSSEDLSVLPGIAGLRLLSYVAAQDPYNARNYGVAQSRGEYLLFLDAKARAAEGFGVAVRDAMATEKRVVAGSFAVMHTDDDNYALYYAIGHLRQAESVVRRSHFLTGNLLAVRSVMEEVGLFPEQMRSGGDVFWSQKVFEAGIAVDYVAEMRVDFPAKDKAQILSSAVRDGRGAAAMHKMQGRSLWFFLKMVLYHLLPDAHSRIKKKALVQISGEKYKARKWTLWAITWRTNLRFAWGYISGLFAS